MPFKLEIELILLVLRLFQKKDSTIYFEKEFDKN